MIRDLRPVLFKLVSLRTSVASEAILRIGLLRRSLCSLLAMTRGENRSKNGFTLLEIIIALTIFTIVMGMVIGLLLDSMRSVQRGEKTLTREQSKRICYLNINKEVSSLTKASPSGFSFSGDLNGFFLSSPVKIPWLSQVSFLIAPLLP